ncbi:MAG TPA: hypothetical protein DCE56_02365 [Cyanobacteria bacterium UBA8553]|nr:hypothetical protein [Cyanobacteria bacterium UBA8553]HAJ64275.1 hypothetical protein [Cyanobacteria bacterium UBA8543]
MQRALEPDRCRSLHGWCQREDCVLVEEEAALRKGKSTPLHKNKGTKGETESGSGGDSEALMQADRIYWLAPKLVKKKLAYLGLP